MSTLEKAISIAAEFHAGQVDKGGMPYILHPLRVMLSMETEDERIAAVLHDVIEDTDCAFSDLRREGFSEDVLDAVKALTRREGESYKTFIERTKGNLIARRVKWADLRDNLDATRIPDLTDADVRRMVKYREALKTILTPTASHQP